MHNTSLPIFPPQKSRVEDIMTWKSRIRRECDEVITTATTLLTHHYHASTNSAGEYFRTYYTRQFEVFEPLVKSDGTNSSYTEVLHIQDIIYTRTPYVWLAGSLFSAGKLDAKEFRD